MAGRLSVGGTIRSGRMSDWQLVDFWEVASCKLVPAWVIEGVSSPDVVMRAWCMEITWVLQYFRRCRDALDGPGYERVHWPRGGDLVRAWILSVIGP